MPENKKNKSFVLYGSYWASISRLADQNLGLLLRAVYHDFLGLPDIDLSEYPDVAMAFYFIVAQLHRDQEKWLNIAEKRSMAGRESGKRRRELREQQANPRNKNEQNEQMLKVFDDVEHNVDDDENIAVDIDGNADADADGASTWLTASIQYQVYLEVFFFRNLVNPRQECDRFVQYYRDRKWTLERGKVLSSIEDRIERATTWTPERDKNGRCRVDPVFLDAWQRVYHRAKEVGAPSLVLSLMLDEGVALEKSIMDPHYEHHFLCPPDVSRYLNSHVETYQDIFDFYIRQTKVKLVYITSIEHREKTK